MDTGTMSTAEQRRRMSSWLLLGGCFLVLISGVIGISDNFPGIVALLLGSLSIVLGIIYRFMRSQRRTAGQQLLYWTPRALCIVFALFVALFALDVFNEGKPFWETTLALLIHLIPTFLIIVVLAFSWRHEWIGGILFIGLALYYIVSAWGRFALSVYVLIAGPLFIIGILFLLNWYHRSELHVGSGKVAG